MRTSTRKGYRKIIESDLEIMPLMNLFVAMIPMLLISAVFLNVTVIDMKAPAEAAESDASAAGLGLTVTIEDDVFVVDGRRVERRVIARVDEDADDQLAASLRAIAERHPDASDVIIVSQPHTSYGDIVAVMDISRESGFPSAALLGAE